MAMADGRSRHIRYWHLRPRRCRAASTPIQRPLAAGQFARSALAWSSSSDGVHDFLPGQRAAGVVAVATNPHGSADVREVDVPGTSDPAEAADDPAVAAVTDRSIRHYLGDYRSPNLETIWYLDWTISVTYLGHDLTGWRRQH